MNDQQKVSTVIDSEDQDRKFRGNLGGDLHFISRELEKLLMQKSIDKGYEGLKLNWDMVFLNIGMNKGIRLVELAEINHMTKQAMSQLVNEIEKHGYLVKAPDPTDGRAKQVMFSEKGRQLVDDSIESMDKIEYHYEMLIGQEKLGQLKDLLAELATKMRQV